MKMTMRKLLAVLATVAMFCAVLPLSTLFVGMADGNVVFDKNFDDGTNGGFERSVNENGYIKFDATTADWQNTYVYANALKAKTDYVVTFKAKANKATNMNFKVVDNWMSDAAAKTVDVTTEWQNFELNINMASLSTGIVMFSSNSMAKDAAIYYIDDVKIVAAGSTPSAPAGGNLVVNGDFENGEAGWTYGSGSHAIVGDAHGGASALQLTNPGMWASGAEQTIAVEPNNQYTITWWYKANAGTGLFNLYVMNAAGYANLTVVSGENFMRGYNGNWQQGTLVVESGSANAIILKWSTEASNPGTILIDDVTVTKVGGGSTPDVPDVPAEGNLIANGDFETGDNTGWETHQSTTISADAAKDGAYGAHLKGNGGWGGMLNQTATVEAGKQYKLSFWVNVNNSGVNLQVKNGAGAVIEGASGWYDANKKDHKVELIFTATDSTALVNFCGGGNGNPEDVYVDNVSLTEVKETPDVPDEPTESGQVVNGDFETGNLDGWTNLWDACKVDIVDYAAHTGNYGLDFTAPGQWSQVRQMVAVKPNTDYVVTAYVKDAKNMQIVVKTEDDQTNIIEQALIESTAWTKNEIRFNSGNEKNVSILIIGVGEVDDNNPNVPSGTALVDDVKIAEDRPLLINGDFEQGDKGWTLGAAASITDELVYAGNGALMLDNPGAWSEAALQTVPLEPNTEYTLKVWYKFDSGAGPINLAIMENVEGYPNLELVEGFNETWFNKTSNEWVEKTIVFKSGEATSALLKWTSEGDNKGVMIVDNMRLYPSDEEPDEPDQPDQPEPPATLSLTEFSVKKNRPESEKANLILNASFEKAEGGQWQEILSDNLTVVEDETAPNGTHSLFFNTSGIENEVKSFFWMEVEPNTEYVFSAWVKGSFLADDARNNATIGVIDETKRFLVYETYDENGNLKQHFSTKKRQIAPPCWDNEWHLRSVQFNSGRATTVGIAVAGANSKIWFDDIALFKLANGIQYMSDTQYSEIIAWEDDAKIGYCADENNLLPNANMEGEENAAFWAGSDGWVNGFVSFYENEYEYGTSLKYTASENACGTHSILWIPVKPNTEYTFSVDMRIIKNGMGKLLLLDGKKRESADFLRIDFDQYGVGIDWFNTTVTFETGAYEQIGISIVDAGGEALIDNMRLFESSNRADKVKDDYVKPPYKFEWDDPVDNGDPDSPNTGVTATMAVVAMALVPTSAAVAFKLRRKKEDEE